MALDPLKTSDEIKKAYIQYLTTTFRFQDEDLNGELKELLNSSEKLIKGPIIEAIPPFETGRSLKDLIQEGILKEVGKGDSPRGKKPLLIDINSDHQYVFGVEISRKGQIILCNLIGTVLEREQFFPDPSQGPGSIAKQLSNEISRLCHLFNLEPNKVAGIGIGTPGFLFKAGPLINQSPFFGWNGINAVQVFESSFSYPVLVENVAKASALAEKMYGYGKQFEDFFYIIFTCTIKNRSCCKYLSVLLSYLFHARIIFFFPSFMSSPSQMSFKNLPYIHTGRNAKRI